MSKSAKSLLLAVVLGTSSALAVAQASPFTFDKEVAWASQRDLTSAEFSAAFDVYRAQGMMPIDIGGHETTDGVRYSMIWQANPDGRAWASRRDMSSDQYNVRWNEYREAGMRPVDLDTYVRNGDRNWSGIWVENKEGLKWLSNRDLDGKRFGELFEERKGEYRLIDIEAYNTSNGVRYAAIWLENREKLSWMQTRDMTRERYQELVDERSAEGFIVVDYEEYETSGGVRYAAIWERRANTASTVRTGRSEQDFANIWREERDKGLRLIDFERRGDRYSGIWIENNARYRTANKATLDSLIETFRTSNTLPGISVAIMHDGEMIYRRGFGQADVSSGKVAHGETVYAMASISKAVAGTLAAKLESRGRLEDGKSISLDLSNTTATYIPNLPSHHTHTLEQLLTHLGCVAYYGGSGSRNTIPGISAPFKDGKQSHFATDREAVQAIWSVSLVTDMDPSTAKEDDCTVGQSYKYSSQAFTFVGAALEFVTGKDIDDLAETEIFKPLGLGSMRSMNRTAKLEPDYERATPYGRRSGAFQALVHEDKSWKVLGGGFESNVVDLVRFGWALDSGRILSDAARDTRLYTRFQEDLSTHAMGWEVDNPGYPETRRTVSHGGSTDGARTLLVIYPDDDLVVGIMTNRRFVGLRLPNLASSLVNTVIGRPRAAVPMGKVPAGIRNIDQLADTEDADDAAEDQTQRLFNPPRSVERPRSQ